MPAACSVFSVVSTVVLIGFFFPQTFLQFLFVPNHPPKNNKIYKYGFDVLKDSIVSEWLYIKKINKFYSIFEREKNNVTMKSNNKISGLANIDERTLFLNIYSKIDKDNEDFNNVYDWFVDANYLDLGNPRFEDFINTRISIKILSY